MRALLLSFAALTLLVPTTTNAKPAFVSSVPNASTLSCNTCHVAGSPKSVRNDFGIDVDATLSGGMPNWAAVCELDSDGDGASNGEELQDALCEWVSGANPGCSALVTAPGDANSVPANSFCGDGSCDQGEDLGCCPQDCEIPDPPPVDEEEADAGGPGDDVMEDDVPPMDDVTPEDDAQVEEDVPPGDDTSVPVPPEDVVPGDDDAGSSEDAGSPNQDVDPGPSEDVSDPPPADAGTTPADAGVTPADTGTAPTANSTDDGGCAANQQATPVWMALLVLLFVPLVMRRRED